MISWIFPSKFQRIHMTSVSGHWMRFIFKICQTVAGIIISSQLHEFLRSHFWRFFCYLAQLTCAGLGSSVTSPAQFYFNHRSSSSWLDLFSRANEILDDFYVFICINRLLNSIYLPIQSLLNGSTILGYFIFLSNELDKWSYSLDCFVWKD